MKSLASVLFLITVMILPSHIFAEDTATYLIHASEEQLEQIKQREGLIIEDYQEVPLLEMELSEKEKADLQKEFSTVEIYPNREYKVAADSVPPSFTATKSTPALTAPYTGKGVRVAVLDTGIDTEHPDLTVAGGVCTAAICSKGVSYDDNFGHGTHVAGIIAAKKNNAGIIGAAPNVELYAIKSLNNLGGGSTAQITKGVEWAIKNKIDILNLSISISINDRPLQLILDEASRQGMLIVSAAGNEGGEDTANTITYPGKYSSVIAVGATNNDLTKEANSSTGPEMEMAAPGLNVYSTFPIELDDQDYVVDGYRMLTGTSMAAPHVTGILAIYKEQHPGLSNYKLREIMQSTAKDLGKKGRDEIFGFGLVQYEKDIKTVPFIDMKVTKGSIEMSLKNGGLAKDWTLSEGGKTMTATSEGKWQTFKTKGTYVFTFNYTDAKGVKKSEKITASVKEPAFPDVTMNAWYAPHISFLYSNNMMSGYKDGTFKPVKEITRGEAMILIGKAQGLNGAKRSTAFNDVSASNTASGYIQSAHEKGIISGFPDGSFKPSQTVTRAEMALLIQAAYNFEADASADMPFLDVHPGMSSYEAIQAITQQEITSGFTATTFEPFKLMNRYTFSVFLAKAENQQYFK